MLQHQKVLRAAQVGMRGTLRVQSPQELSGHRLRAAEEQGCRSPRQLCVSYHDRAPGRCPRPRSEQKLIARGHVHETATWCHYFLFLSSYKLSYGDGERLTSARL
jgi:hypothetical protein